MRGPFAVLSVGQDKRIIIASMRQRFAILEPHLAVAYMLADAFDGDMVVRPSSFGGLLVKAVEGNAPG